MIATCPTADELQSLTLGMLPEERSDDLFRHLEACEDCRLGLAELESLEDTLVQSLRQETPADGFKQEPEYRWASARALAALAEVEHVLPDLPGRFGDYEVIRPLGRGGMGHVFLGQHTKLAKPVAIKVIANHRQWDEGSRRRFAAEARAMGQLNHPHIVTAYDAREVDGLAVLITEFVDGLNLSEVIRCVGPLSVAESTKIAVDLCEALGYCHRSGLLHRDVKPSNVMIDRSGHVKLLDLGLAQAADHDQLDLTATGQALGTADYVAPEQIDGSSAIDSRADIYGLGCTLYKLLAGEAPFAGTEYATVFAKLNAHVSRIPKSLGTIRPDIPDGLSRLVDRMLAKLPQDRPESMAEIRSQLDAWTGTPDLSELVDRALAVPEQGRGEQDTLAPPLSTTAGSGRFSRGSWGWIALASAACAFTFGLWLGITITVRKPDGTTAQVTIPDGATAVIDEQGDVQITLPGSDESVTIPSDRVSGVDKTQANPDRDGATATETPPIPINRVPSNVVVLKPADPLFGKLVEGDRVFVLAVDRQESQLTLPELLFTTTVAGVQNDGAGQGIQVSPGPNQGDEQIQKARLAGKQIELALADPRANVPDDSRLLQGMWRPILQLDRTGGALAESLRNSTLLIAQNELLVVTPQQVDGLNYSLMDVGRVGKEIAISNPLRSDLPPAICTYELHGADKFDIGGPFGRLRLERVQDGPRSETEQRAAEILKSIETAGVALRCFLTDPETGDELLVIQNRDLRSAIVVPNAKPPQILLTLDGEANRRLYLVSSRYLGKQLRVEIAGKTVSTSEIREPISSPIMLVLDIDPAEVKLIANRIVPRLKVDAMPVESRAESLAKLRSMMTGVLDYESVFRKLPVSAKSMEGHPVSWRVMLLPYVGEEDLYQQYRLDEPWDSEHNRKLLARMPELYRHPASPSDSTTTDYVAVSGADTYIGQSQQQSISAVIDGTSNTVAIVESSTKIPWTKPEDLSFEDPNLLARVQSITDKQQILAGIGDGSAMVLSRDKLTEAIWRELLKVNDGQVNDGRLLLSLSSLAPESKPLSQNPIRQLLGIE